MLGKHTTVTMVTVPYLHSCSLFTVCWHHVMPKLKADWCAQRVWQLPSWFNPVWIGVQLARQLPASPNPIQIGVQLTRQVPASPYTSHGRK
eukprot:1086-Pelagomonas_calceolata.AAC.1